jgi:energy-coupling factor transporter ATP-binding protein EcfA2
MHTTALTSSVSPTRVSAGAAIPRLSEVLFRTPRRGFGSFAALPSNVQAIEAAMLFANESLDLVALVGPSGWGKTHLLEAVGGVLERHGRGRIGIMSSSEWAQASFRHDPRMPLLLDNVQESLERPKERMRLQLALQRRVRAGLPTFLCFTAPKVSRSIKSFLPLSRTWFIAPIDTPKPCERELVIRQMAATEDLDLSDVLVKLLAQRMLGNGRTLQGALKRLKLSGQKCGDIQHVLRACGVLNPFFADCSSWDLRDHILEIAAACAPDRRSAEDLAVYTMLRIALLPEACVAQYLDLPPAQAYARAADFEQRLSESSEARQNVRQFLSQVVDALQNDA